MAKKSKVVFREGVWDGKMPPSGKKTSRQKVGSIADKYGFLWDVYYWRVDYVKSPAAQFIVRRNSLSCARKIFFSTRKQAIAWLKNPTAPTVNQIAWFLSNRCEFQKPSKGKGQLWASLAWE